VDPVRNPYAPGAGQRPPELAGRDRELDQFAVVLERVALGRPERSLVLTGLRGVGKTVLLNGCSFMDELGYREELEAWEQDPAYRLSFVPTISRPADPRNAGWTGRTGRAEQVIADTCKEFGLRPDKTVVYICGNPEMILNAERTLMDRGFPEFHVKKELYWPKGKPGAVPNA